MALSGRVGSSTTKVYTYDRLNRLMQYNDGSTEAVYTYGIDNLRASKKVNGEKTEFVWNGQNLAGETTNGISTIYNYDVTGIAGYKKDNEEEVRYIKDPHGNVIDMQQGYDFIGSYDYSAFGNQFTSTNEDNPLRYCGEYYDKESGNIYLRNRYYNAPTGRFISEDPIKDGLNWYSYCGGNPVMFVDPLGLAMDTDEEHRKELKSLLLKLCDNSLEIDYDEERQRFDVTKVYDTKNHVGQKLVYDLLTCDEKITVNFGIDPNAQNDELLTNKFSGNSANTVFNIWIDPDVCKNTVALMMDIDTGNIDSTAFDDFIVLGHEMIHVWRCINNLYLPYAYEPGGMPDAEYRYGTARQEELQTTGLFYNAENHINPNSFYGTMTENGLRLENGLKLRLQY